MDLTAPAMSVFLVYRVAPLRVVELILVHRLLMLSMIDWDIHVGCAIKFFLSWGSGSATLVTTAMVSPSTPRTPPPRC